MSGLGQQIASDSLLSSEGDIFDSSFAPPQNKQQEQFGNTFIQEMVNEASSQNEGDSVAAMQEQTSSAEDNGSFFSNLFNNIDPSMLGTGGMRHSGWPRLKSKNAIDPSRASVLVVEPSTTVAAPT